MNAHEFEWRAFAFITACQAAQEDSHPSSSHVCECGCVDVCLSSFPDGRNLGEKADFGLLYAMSNSECVGVNGFFWQKSHHNCRRSASSPIPKNAASNLKQAVSVALDSSVIKEINMMQFLAIDLSASQSCSTSMYSSIALSLPSLASPSP